MAAGGQKRTITTKSKEQQQQRGVRGEGDVQTATKKPTRTTSVAAVPPVALSPWPRRNSIWAFMSSYRVWVNIYASFYTSTQRELLGMFCQAYI